MPCFFTGSCLPQHCCQHLLSMWHSEHTALNCTQQQLRCSTRRQLTTEARCLKPPQSCVHWKDGRSSSRTRCWKMCSLPRRICGNSGCKLASSQIIAMRVKQPRSLPCDTSCTISVFLVRLRARCLHTASPRFWSQCSLQEVSSRLIRSTALFTDCSSAKFQSCHAASACQGTLHHRLINMVWQDVTTYFGGNPMFSVELRAGRWGFRPLAHKPPNAGSIQKGMLGLLNCRARKDD